MEGVRKMQMFFCSCDQEGITKERQLETERHFNNHGQPTEETNFQGGLKIGFSKRSYNDYGKLLSIQLFDDSNFCYHEEAFSYDEKEILKEKKVVYHETGTHEFVLYSYNSQGKLVSEVTKDDQGEMTLRLEYIYDEKGRKTEESCFDEEENALDWRHIYHYHHEKDLLLKEERFGPDEEPLDIRYYHYNEKDLGVEETINRPDGTLKWKRNCEYNDSQLMIREVESDFEGGKKYLREYEYDKDGNVSKERSFDGDQLMQEMVFSYDSKGNVVRELFLSAVRELGDYCAYSAVEYDYEYEESDL